LNSYQYKYIIFLNLCINLEMINRIINEIKNNLRKQAPSLSKEDEIRKNKILNSTNPNFISYGLKMEHIEKVVKEAHQKYGTSYDDAETIFKELIYSNIHEEKFAAILFLNQSKKKFDETTINLIRESYYKSCDTWALCDSTMIKVIGPFLGKRGNEKLAKKTIESWSNSENIWLRRASMVLLLKLAMLKKDFNETQVFDLVEKMFSFSENYIQKGIGWLLKTCSKYKPEVIIKYLNKNKKRMTRLVLRYATEKLPDQVRFEILKK